MFGRKGYRDATVADIVAEAGLSTGALYNHFARKSDVFLAVFDDRFTEWVAGYDATFAGAEAADDTLRAISRHYGELLRESPEDAQLLFEFWAAAMRDESLRPAFALRHAAIRGAMAALIERVQERLGARASVPAYQLGAIVTALADGLAMQRLVDPGAPDHGERDLLLVALELLAAGAFEQR